MSIALNLLILKWRDVSMFGMEYGIKPTVAVIGDLEFPNLLRDAGLIGVGYLMPRHVLQPVALQMGLIFENPVLGKIGFERFLEWIKGSQGNTEAISIEFVEHNAQSYTLCISQGIDQLISRCIPAYLVDWVSPLISVVSYRKKIDIVSGAYFDFKEMAKQRKIHMIAMANRPGFYPVQIHESEIIKDKVFFFQEENIPEYSIGMGAVKSKIKRGFPPKPSVELIEAHRLAVIKHFFPVTYEKYFNQAYFAVIKEELANQYLESEILQAICNIATYYKLERQQKLGIVEKSDSCQFELLKYISQNQETFSDVLREDKIDRELIINQISLDRNIKNQLKKGKL